MKHIICLLLIFIFSSLFAQVVDSTDVEVTSGDKIYQSYLAAPTEEGTYPGIVLIHSFRGLQDGYRTMTDWFAAQGFVVLAVGWQTYEQSPNDELVLQLVKDSMDFLSQRGDVDSAKLGLTGFCAGGRYTMLLLPQIEALGAGVAWYGFPYRGDTQPAELIEQLSTPMLIIHGTADEPSPMSEIYEYATALDEAGKAFELKVYQGEPHGFMLSSGQLREDEVAQNALEEMISFFRRKLN